MRARTWCAVMMLLTACVGDSPVETITDPPQTLILVQGVMRTDQAQQFILVERTFNGTVAGYGGGSYLPGAGVPVPIEDADVTISNVSYPGDPCGVEMSMREDAGPPDRRQPGAYFSPIGCPTMRPGDTLRVVVTDGDDRAVGTTVVPGLDAVTLSAAGTTIPVPGPTVEFNRDRDTLEISVEATSGRILLTEVHDRRFVETGAYLAFQSAQVWVDGDELTLPGTLLNFLTQDVDLDDDIPSVFNGGRLVAVTVAYGDDAFHDQIRSGNNPITGRGFINRIEGGYGFVGSISAVQTTLRVVSDIDDPREGTYRMSGRLLEGADSVDVDVSWELYLNDEIRVDGDPTGRVEHSAFVLGEWVTGAYDAYTQGTFQSQAFSGFVYWPAGTDADGNPVLRVWELTGRLPDSGTTTLRVREGGRDVGQLEVERVPGA